MKKEVKKAVKVSKMTLPTEAIKPRLQVEKVNHLVDRYLSSESKRVLTNKIYSVKGKDFEAYLFGVTSNEAGKEKAIKKLAKNINRITSIFNVKGQLGDCTQLRLNGSKKSPKVIFFVYLALNPLAVKIVKKLHPSVLGFTTQTRTKVTESK